MTDKVPKKPESLVKKDIKSCAQREKRIIEKVAKRKAFLAKKILITGRAQKYAAEYAREKVALTNNLRSAKTDGNFFVKQEPKLAFVIRLKGINKIAPKPKKVMQLFRLRQINNGVFVKLNKATLQMLRLIEPYVAWGYPSQRMVKKLVYKRGFAKINGSRIPIDNNDIIEQQLGKHGIVCVEDLIHEIYTVGPHFKEANSFLYYFKLNNPRGGFRKKSNHFVEGGDFGNREEYINKLVDKMC